MAIDPRKLARPLVRNLHPYVPGEQPKIANLIKLNTNENPYPPAPAVLKAVKKAVDARLRLYPNATSQALREKLADLHGCSPANIIVGNGSDELLALAVRAFADPVKDKPDARSTVQFFSPGYSLYPILVETHGAAANAVALNADFSLPKPAQLKRDKQWMADAGLTLLTTPNAPGGRGYATSELDVLCALHKGALILDEAYVDFAEENAMALALKHPHVMVARTFSKAFSLCFQRIGYIVGHPEVIAAMDRIRDSYNVNGLGQVAALETLNHLPYYRKNFERIKKSRALLTEALTGFGFEVLPSQTNFILARPPRFPASEWLQKLRDEKLLVRWFKDPRVSDFLRITIGTEKEVACLIRTARKILK